nr:hypothetical protein [Tanacetum cinerariifolium]
PAISSDVVKLRDMVRALLLDKKNQSSALAQPPTPTPVKAVNQPPAYQAPIPQTQRVSQTDFESYVKANDAILRNMQSHDLKGITTRSGVAYQGPTIPTMSKVVKQGTEVTKDQVQTPSSQSTAPIQRPVIQSETQTLISEPVVAPVTASMPNLKPYMSFEISFTDALIFMPKFASTLKALIGNKDKLSEMTRTLMNEHYSAVILNKFPRKLGDPGKFLIPCEFSRMDECLALADLAEVVDFEPDPRVPLILGRCFLKTDRALIDVHKEELTLRIGNEAITYNLDQTVRYSANYNQMTANNIDVIDMACKEYSQEVLGFFDVITSGNPTPHDDPIVSTTSPTLTL